MPSKAEYEELLLDIWEEAQNCGGSRGDMSSCLDTIQNMIEELIPDAAERMEED
jgi:hypothetical protein